MLSGEPSRAGTFKGLQDKATPGQRETMLEGFTMPSKALTDSSIKISLSGIGTQSTTREEQKMETFSQLLTKYLDLREIDRGFVENYENEPVAQRHARVNEMESLLRKMDRATEQVPCTKCMTYGEGHYSTGGQ